MTLREVGRICDALRKERSLVAEVVRAKMEDGKASPEERAEFSRWLHHDMGILDAENAILKAMYREENPESSLL